MIALEAYIKIIEYCICAPSTTLKNKNRVEGGTHCTTNKTAAVIQENPPVKAYMKEHYKNFLSSTLLSLLSLVVPLGRNTRDSDSTQCRQ